MINENKLERMIQNLWLDMKCPIINGVIYGNGVITKLNMDSSPSINKTPHLHIVGITDVEKYVNECGERFVEIDELCCWEIEATQCKAIGGEGGMGGDGFIALVRNVDNYLLWLAFFDDSNPFIKVLYDEERSIIQGITSHNHLWEFSVDSPELVTVCLDDQKNSAKIRTNPIR